MNQNQDKFANLLAKAASKIKTESIKNPSRLKEHIDVVTNAIGSCRPKDGDGYRYQAFADLISEVIDADEHDRDRVNYILSYVSKVSVIAFIESLLELKIEGIVAEKIMSIVTEAESLLE